MDYPSKVVYNGILVDVADIVCPGTELAHYSVGNLKKMINSFYNSLSGFSVEIKNFKQECLNKINLLSITMNENATKYPTIIAEKLSDEYNKYKKLYEELTDLNTNTKNLITNVSATNAAIINDISNIKKEITAQENGYVLLLYDIATLADQIITIKKNSNLIKEWIAAITKFAKDNNDKTDYENLIKDETKQLKTFVEDELKYNKIVDITAEWSEFLSDYHPMNKEDDEEEEEEVQEGNEEEVQEN